MYCGVEVRTLASLDVSKANEPEDAMRYLEELIIGCPLDTANSADQSPAEILSRDIICHVLGPEPQGYQLKVLSGSLEDLLQVLRREVGSNEHLQMRNARQETHEINADVRIDGPAFEGELPNPDSIIGGIAEASIELKCCIGMS